MSAVTVIQQPPGYLQSANNDSVFVLTGSSGTSSSFDFHYIADVIANGSRVTTLKTFPDPASGYGVFNLRNITPSLVSYDFLPTESGGVFHTASNSSVNVQLSFGKEYSVFSGSFTQSRNEVSSSQFAYINSALSYTEMVSTNLSASYGIPWTGSSFLTRVNFTIPTYNNIKQWLYYYNSGSLTTYLRIKTYDSNNGNLGDYVVYNAHSDFHGVVIASSGIPQLSSLVSGSVTFNNPTVYQVNSGNPVMLNSSVDHYSVNLTGDGFATFSKTVNYQILQDCSRFASYAYKVYWLNTLGGFDSWLFNKIQTTTVSKNQTTFKRLPGTLNPDGSFSFNTYDRSIIPYYTELDTKIQLSTDFLTDQQVLFLKGLYGSPVIFLEDSNGVLINATIDTSVGYTLNKSAINTKAYALTMTFIPSITDFRQAQ